MIIIFVTDFKDRFTFEPFDLEKVELISGYTYTSRSTGLGRSIKPRST